MDHPMKRYRALWALVAVLLAVTALPVFAHDVKDPVCRMTVDSDTAKFRHRLGNKTFYFCSKACETTFEANPRKYEKLADALERQDLHDYAVQLSTDHAPMAGAPVQLTLAIRYADSKKLVAEYELVHERLVHLIMTTEDMSWFEHQHPVRGADGLFRLTWTFPRPGKYRLYADFTPSDGDNQVLPLTLTVGGGTARALPLVPDRTRAKQVGDLRFELQVRPGTPLRMERPALLTYVIRDRNGRPVRDLQPFIGAMGHLLAISRDGQEVIHTHVIQSAAAPSMGHAASEPIRVTPAMVTASGPTLTFKLTLPSGGLYKTWAQFMRGNKVYTVPFTFAVQDLWGVPAAAAKRAPRPAATPAPAAGAQRATIVIDGEYRPARVSVRAGKPVVLTFVRKETAGCGERVRFPSLGLGASLKAGERKVVTFTPKHAGRIAFTCGMGMYRGEILVR
jgi:YHS domain-containing protein